MARDLRQAFASQARLARRRFLEFVAKGRETQAKVLEQAIRPNEETVFGREHGFRSTTDLATFKKSVPIRHYDDLEPWIDRQAAAEPQVLTHEDPIRFWKTTGTTSKSKKIPVTPASNARTTESFLALQGTQLHHYPDVLDRSDAMLYMHISPRPVKELLGGRFPYCTTTEIPVDVRPGHEELLAPWMVPLQEVVENDAERLYFLLCFAALHDLRAIGCLHPSRFQTVVSALHDAWPRLVKELHDGTVLGKRFRDPRPERAKELEAIAKAKGTLLPRDVWPGLRFSSSWSGSYAGRYAPLREEAFTKAFLPMPSISSECFMTMTIDEDRIAQPLNVRGGVFEFVPSGDRVEAATPTLEPHELVTGAAYEVVITTFGGLYRYATCDIFRVTGFVEQVPRLEYIGRRAVSDLTGEKLAEEQVTDVLAAAFAELAVDATSFTMCAIQEVATGKRPHYVLVLEPNGAWSEERSTRLAARVEAGFRAVNSRYAMKRNFDDLDPVAVEAVPSGTFGRYRALLIERGMPAGQLKERVLHASGAAVLADLVGRERSA